MTQDNSTVRQVRAMRVKGVLKRQFQNRLVEFCGGCTLQHTGWPCATCFHNALTSTGLTDDRADFAWIAVLAFRGDYTTPEYRTPTTFRFPERGRYSAWVEYPLAAFQEAIQLLWDAVLVSESVVPPGASYNVH